jgi:hypothetical protein
MMRAVMMAPVGVGATRGAMMAKDALPIRSHHQAAAWCSDNTGIDGGIIVIGIIIGVVVVIDAANEYAADAMPVTKPVSGKSGTPRNDGRPGAVRAAANGGATETATAAITTAMTASAAAVSTADFNRESIGGSLACRRASWIDRRQRFSTLAGERRQCEQ